MEIFPHESGILTSSAVINGQPSNTTDSTHDSPNTAHTDHTHQHDILLSLIPGDRSKKSIRIYPSRPSSAAGTNRSIKSKNSYSKIHHPGDQLDRGKDSSVLVTMKIDLP